MVFINSGLSSRKYMFAASGLLLAISVLCFCCRSSLSFRLYCFELSSRRYGQTDIFWPLKVLRGTTIVLDRNSDMKCDFCIHYSHTCPVTCRGVVVGEAVTGGLRVEPCEVPGFRVAISSFTQNVLSLYTTVALKGIAASWLFLICFSVVY